MAAERGGTRERLLEVGVAALIEKGFHAAGLTEILAAAGVPKGSFYHHFRSKEDFGVAIVDHCGDQHRERLRAALHAGEGSPRARLRAHFQACRDHYVDRGLRRECLVSKLGLEVAALSPPIRAAIRATLDRWRALVADGIRDAQAAGEVPVEHDADALADFLTNAWEGAVARMQIDESRRPLDHFLAFVFGVVLPEV